MGKLEGLGGGGEVIRKMIIQLEKIAKKADLKSLTVLDMSWSLATERNVTLPEHLFCPWAVCDPSPSPLILALTFQGLFVVHITRTFRHLLWLPTVNTKRTNSLIY